MVRAALALDAHPELRQLIGSAAAEGDLLVFPDPRRGKPDLVVGEILTRNGQRVDDPIR